MSVIAIFQHLAGLTAYHRWGRDHTVPFPTADTNNEHGETPPTQRLASDGWPPSVVAVAVVQVIGSLPILYFCGINLWGDAWVTHELWSSPIGLLVLGLPFLFSLVAVVTAVGLLRLRGWARRATLWLATLPLAGCALFLILYSSRPYDILRPIAKILIWILAAISIWWWVLFTRSSVRSRFRQD